MSYVVAFSVDGGGIDVTRAYIPAEEWEAEESGKRIKDMREKAGTEEDGVTVSVYKFHFHCLFQVINQIDWYPTAPGSQTHSRS